MNIIKGEKSITIEFNDEEMVILSDSLLNPLDHFETVAREKVANCTSRLIQGWTNKLQQEKRVPAIPTDDTELIDLIKAQPDYKNRAGRDQEAITL